MFDPVLLKTFLAVERTGGFTAAARVLGLRQSTVSGHIARLEKVASRELITRDTHTVELTADGTAMVGFARSILDAHERADRYFAGSTLTGRLRFGAAEDLVAKGLPQILRDFRRTHPLVDLQLTVGLSRAVHAELRAGDLDLAFVMRRPGETHGELVWRDRLVWGGTAESRWDPGTPVPLVVYPPPSITRACALDTLEAARLPSRVTCLANSRAGLRAAVLAGLGMIVHANSLLPTELRPVGDRLGLPDPGDVEFVLLGRPGPPSDPETALMEAIRASAL
ncbi:LysR family transcriptional regulator [Rhodococcus sp. SGAir0479]|uniref:LysR family transcriptional regulator n=1 Tax=Rhodococcus sp. SGAir0479 TaxID=2567884 RepID=UPI0010CD3099|nr:LysR substrate-binding domain-containing protein [Rhodococcus sp. SGAir0479]QCQ93011.1 LysR family transcriptional regulator [Rhodococcus sp. SGAir0479]